MGGVGHRLVVAQVGVPAALPNPECIERLLVAIGADTQPKGTDAKLLMGRSRQWLKVIRRVAPFVGDDLLDLADDTILSIAVETLQLEPGSIGELPGPLTHHYGRPRRRSRPPP